MSEQPAVECRACEKRWYSDAMAHGLALLGSCPRCGGEIVVHREAAAPAERRFTHTDAPERVLGRPRPQRI